MIFGIGIDSVEVHRFKEYQSYETEKLLKLFSQQEIDYCLGKPQPSLHFASRFAVREAFFKAYQGMLHHYQQEHTATLLTINKNIEVLHASRGLPFIQANWTSLLPAGISPAHIHISITHTQEIATAFVILSSGDL